MDHSDLLEIFYEESEAQLQALEEGLLSLEKSEADEEILNGIFRAAHTIKGSAAIVRATGLEEFSHLLENVLAAIRDQRLSPDAAAITLILEAVDEIRKMIECLHDGEDRKADAELSSRVRQLLERDDVPSPSTRPQKSRPTTADTEKTYTIDLHLLPEIFETGFDPLMVFAELRRLGEILDVQAVIEDLPKLKEFDPTRLYLRWLIRFRTGAALKEIDNVFLFLIDDNPIRIEEVAEPPSESFEAPLSSGAAASVLSPQGLRIDQAQLDQLIDTSGELLIEIAALRRILREERCDHPQLEALGEKLESMGGKIRDRSLMLRMVPLDHLFRRFHRGVRDLSLRLGKRVRLKIEGGDTQLDKQVSDSLGEPLLHLIRNAAFHGIETPEERSAAGKDPVGHLRLAARQEAGRIIIEVGDDGRGVDLEALSRQALESGRVHEGATKKEILETLFDAGISTVDEVNDLAGRGVGLDSVRSTVRRLGGTIEIMTTKGRGTTFKLSVPLSQTIIPVLKARIGSGIYLVPTLSVVEHLRAWPNEIKSIEHLGEVFRYQGRYLPLLNPDVFPGDGSRPEQCSGREIILVLNGDRGDFGLLVDEVQEQLDILFKKVELGGLDWASGAAILDDGRPSLILNIPGLYRKFLAEHSQKGGNT